MFFHHHDRRRVLTTHRAQWRTRSVSEVGLTEECSGPGVKQQDPAVDPVRSEERVVISGEGDPLNLHVLSVHLPLDLKKKYLLCSVCRVGVNET